MFLNTLDPILILIPKLQNTSVSYGRECFASQTNSVLSMLRAKMLSTGSWWATQSKDC